MTTTSKPDGLLDRIGMIGLGRMGANLARRLHRHGITTVAYDRDPVAAETLEADGVAVAARDLAELVAELDPPRAVWIMVPAGVVDDVIADLVPLLDVGDIVIDGGNTHYVRDLQRSAQLAAAGLGYLDVGTSGGVWGLERGYCLMIGGERELVERLEPVFEALAPGLGAAPRTPGRGDPPTAADKGYLHCGPAGAGHFVKMVHNGIEYGVMAAYAEGFNLLSRAGVGRTDRPIDAGTAPVEDPARFQYDFALDDIAELWRRGSVIGSWLLDLTAAALAADPTLDAFEGRVSDSGEGRWALQAGIESGTPLPLLADALFTRFASRDNDEFARQVFSALRAQFGGHGEASPTGPAHD